jgi:hypothetical protein
MATQTSSASYQPSNDILQQLIAFAKQRSNADQSNTGAVQAPQNIAIPLSAVTPPDQSQNPLAPSRPNTTVNQSTVPQDSAAPPPAADNSGSITPVNGQALAQMQNAAPQMASYNPNAMAQYSIGNLGSNLANSPLANIQNSPLFAQLAKLLGGTSGG